MKFLIRFVAFFAVVGVPLFAGAGRLDVVRFWTYLAIPVIASAVNLAVLRRRDPSLIEERVKPAERGEDPHMRLLSLVAFGAHLLVAGLDVRFGWRGTVPVAAVVAGQAGVALALGLANWAVWSNRFASSAVRIQRDRGHSLVTGGPYRWVRHPMYAATFVCLPCSALGLGSYWSILPLLPVAGLLVRRTLREERLLRDELDGYAEYASRVRFRVLPGVW